MEKKANRIYWQTSNPGLNFCIKVCVLRLKDQVNQDIHEERKSQSALLRRMPHWNFKQLISEWLCVLLSHNHVKLVLNFRADAGCYCGGQLVLRSLQWINHLLQLTNYRVSSILFTLLPVFDMRLQLLNVCWEKQRLVISSWVTAVWWGYGATTKSIQRINLSYKMFLMDNFRCTTQSVRVPEILTTYPDLSTPKWYGGGVWGVR